jgi:hypothetical protein
VEVEATCLRAPPPRAGLEELGPETRAGDRDLEVSWGRGLAGRLEAPEGPGVTAGVDGEEGGGGATEGIWTAEAGPAQPRAGRVGL